MKFLDVVVRASLLASSGAALNATIDASNVFFQGVFGGTGICLLATFSIMTLGGWRIRMVKK